MIQLQATLDAGEIPVLVDPDASILTELPIPIVVDARLTKNSPAPLPAGVALHIGLGPGFYAGRDCQAVIETRRSHTLGRVYWDGTTQFDSGQPEGDPHRVLRAPADGQLVGYAQIGDHLEEGDLVAEIHPATGNRGSEIGNRKSVIVSPFKGILRGLIHPGLHVKQGFKVGDVDPRDDPQMCYLVSDKALAIGGAVLEALLSQEEFRMKLWG
jgi:xanthine dehydrogenase accessory factor